MDIMTRQQTLSAIVRESHVLFARYLAGFGSLNCLATAPNLPNHLTWTLGHLSITMYRSAAKLDGLEPPQSVFVDGPVGDSLRYGIESIAFGSRPKVDASIYPPFERCIQIFDDSFERICAAFEQASDSTIDKQVAWGKQLAPAWSLAARMAFHNGTHCGQIVDLRRALGMKSIFG
jgi:hypothetical protein